MVLGNTAGAGLRWGNGLNVKMKCGFSTNPSKAWRQLKAGCYLPGCDGIEAGPPVDIHIKNGRLETVLDVGGHSGPFEIEVITEKGNVRYLFGRSGHIERQNDTVSSGFTNYFSALSLPTKDQYQSMDEVSISLKTIKTKRSGRAGNSVSGQTRNLTLSIKQNQPAPAIYSFTR